MKTTKKNNRLLRIVLTLIVILPGIASTASSETLQDAWKQALGENRGYRSTQQNAEAAASTVDAAKALKWGRADLSAGFIKIEDQQALKADLMGQNVLVPIFEEESLSYGLIATLPIYTGGRISEGIGAAQSLHAAALDQVSTHEQNLKMKVANAYVTVLRAKRILRQAQSHVKNLQAHQYDVEGLYKQGMVIVSDKLSVQVALADARQGVLKAKNGLDLAKAAYNNLLMRPLEADVALEETQAVNDLSDASLDDLTLMALENRKELHTYENSITALGHKKKVIQGGKLPQVGIIGGYLYQEDDYLENEGNWMVGVQVKMNLFDGREKTYKEQAVSRQVRALHSKLSELRALISLQVRQAWLDKIETGKRIRVTEEATALAEENLKVVRDRYVNGFTSHTEVLDAETLRVNSQTNAANAFYDWILARFCLKYSLGRL
ncbi:TolC family protein [Desulfobacter sp.]|uniref:TolC family protein n=1 Tax=Desulfobacter sp. TaxID=2294 RepID=UPI003D0A8A61